MLSNPLKLLLALVVVAGLSPLADAHTCQPGVYSVDPNHGPALICNLAVCIRMPHVCVPRFADTDDAAPLLP